MGDLPERRSRLAKVLAIGGGILLAVLLGETPFAQFAIGFVEGMTHTQIRRDLGKEVGDAIRQDAENWWAREQRQAELERENTHLVKAAPASGYPGYCSTSPSGNVDCCSDHSQQVYVKYQGSLSPYAYGGIRFSEACY